MTTFQNSDINKEHCYIVNTEKNNTEDLKEQYNAYMDWRKEYKINDIQITELLSYYAVRDNTKENLNDSLESKNFDQVHEIIMNRNFKDITEYKGYSFLWSCTFNGMEVSLSVEGLDIFVNRTVTLADVKYIEIKPDMEKKELLDLFKGR